MFLVYTFSDICQECSRPTTDVFNSHVFWDYRQGSKSQKTLTFINIDVRTSNLASDILFTRHRLSSEIACIQQNRPSWARACVCGRQSIFIFWNSRYCDWWLVCVFFFDFWQGQEILFSNASVLAVEPSQNPAYWVPWALFPVVKRPKQEPNRSPPSNIKVKTRGTISPCFLILSWRPR